MDFTTIEVAIGSDYVAVITLNRPQALNTFTLELAGELTTALETLDERDDTRVIIIRGAGKAFSAGIDVSDFFGKSAMEYKAWIEAMEKPLITISRLRKPVIAQVHGVAAANGAGLVAAADLAVMASSARYGLTAINVGLNCVGPVIPVSKSVGRKRALELLFDGQLIKADRALEMGLVNRVVADEELEQETRQWAAALAAKSPIALQIAKTGFYNAADLDYQQAFEYMNEVFARMCTTADAEEGIKAFMEKRQPNWQEK
ncbi:MAG: enoyl-CoA hydratase/isomerase family protein [Deltaproteobacteria bacterium]|nr:enoyl-CoA hydratase/isomerase family protein [Deltaproteobacteria bacterium]